MPKPIFNVSIRVAHFRSYIRSYIRGYIRGSLPDNAPFWRREKMGPPLLGRKSQLPTSLAANVHSCQAQGKQVSGRNRPLRGAETCRRRAGEKSSFLPLLMALSVTGGSVCHTENTGVTRRHITTQAPLQVDSGPAFGSCAPASNLPRGKMGR